MVLLLAACTSHSETRHGTSLPHASSPELAAIDSLMWRQPDSALAVLQQFAASSEADSLNEFNEHYCQLLISELLYKNDYGQSNRPALQQAVAYFDSLILTLKDTPTLKRPIAGTDPLSLTRNDNIHFLTARAHYINGVGYYEHDSVVEACGNTMKVSMDGRGRAKDNIWIERFWRTIKREYIYLNPCDNAIELRKGIEKFMQYYNTDRHHQGIDNETPERKYENNKLLIRTHKAA